MKSRNISKTGLFCDYVAEKLLEWIEYLSYLFRRRREWTSNLTESYHIYKKQCGKQFVVDFLKERERALALNRYKMEKRVIDEDCDNNTIGKVFLCRKHKIISTAILRTKESDNANNKLIYWSFEN